MNRELMHQVANAIELEGRFDLTVYEDENKCGTVRCVAGWTNFLVGNEVCDYRAAARELGLTTGQAGDLFLLVSVCGGPGDGNHIWHREADHLGWDVDAGEHTITAVQAAKLLRQIADGEVEL